MKPNVTKFEKDHWFFITSSVLNFTHLFLKREYALVVLNSLNHFVKKRKLHIGAFVLMPNHIHIIAKTLSDCKWSDFNWDFKKFTAQQLIFKMQDTHDNILHKFIVKKKDRNIQIWKRDPNIQNIYSPSFMTQKANYIHNNPCQEHWNLVDAPEDYEFSSASFYIKNETNKYIQLFDLRAIL